MLKRFLGILFIIPASLYAQDKWSLRECVEYARQHNISVQQADVQARVAALQLKQARLYKIPTATATSNVGAQFGRSIDPTTNQFTTTQLLYQDFQLQGGVTIYTFGRLKNNARAAEFDAKAALTDVERTANDVGLNVASYYLQVLQSKEQIEISNVQISQTQTQFDITKKKVDAGALPELNLAELQSQLATDSTNLITAQSNFDQNMLALKALLNIDLAAPFEIETPPVETIPLESLADMEPEYVYALALQTQPQQREDSFRILGAEKYILFNKAGLYPSLSGFYSLGSTYNNQALRVIGTTNVDNLPVGSVNIGGVDYPVFSQQPFTQNTYGKTQYAKQIGQNFSQSIGIGLNIPILNNGTARIAYENSKLTLRSYQLQKQQNNLTLKSNIYNAHVTAKASMEKYYAGLVSVDAAQKAYDFAQKRYDVGLLSTIDLLTNQNNLLTAKLQQLLNHYDYIFKMKVLEFYKGQGLKL